jgi:hypothetical protein
MVWVVREYSKMDARGRSRKVVVHASLTDDQMFEVPYRADTHRHSILSEIRFYTGARAARNKKYDQKLALLWKKAILRDAPLLKGFFAEEPSYRPRMLRWCEKVLVGGSRK